MADQNKNFNKAIQDTDKTNGDVIKGSYQVITPNPPPDPKPSGNWGTAVPTSNTPNASDTQNNSTSAQKDR